jgi:ribonuclease HI
MEFTAILKELEFLPMVRAYVVIESDSEGCLGAMLGNVKGLRVKNQGLVHQITLRLRTLHAQFRKVKGYHDDQWNDRTDALPDMGRDAALD